LSSSFISRRTSLWLPVIAYMTMLFGLSSMSTVPSPPGDLSDKDVHLGAYSGLGALTTRALASGITDVTWRSVGGAIVISSLYGVSDEFHQRYVPGRSFETIDMLADAIGSATGAIAVGAWSIIRRRL
jgi:VanZ family protein